jgi:hypothetical protein
MSHSWVIVLALVGGADPDPKFTSETLASVEDDAPVRNAAQNRDEALAYDLLVLHARQMPADVLRRAARRDLTFAHLFGPERAKYRGELVHVEGRLRLLRRYDPPDTLRDGAWHISDLYEGWVFIEDYGKNPYCVVVTELPGGLKPAEKLDLPVAVDAYFFKRYLYGARDGRRLSPLLIGRTITPLAEPAGQTGGNVVWAVPGAVLAATFGVIGLTAAAGIAVVWWFRRQDGWVRARLQRAHPDPADFAVEPADDRPLFDREPSNN